jgi:glyoxylase-like metal-dependent hydrolase (beta-lactamase superfamily II)
MISVLSFTFNPFQENTYLLFNEQGSAVIVDPGCWNKPEQDQLLSAVTSRNLTVKRLINTHCHIDHVLGNAWCHRTFGVLPEYHTLESAMLQRVVQSAHVYGFQGYDESPEAVSFIREGEELVLDDDRLKVLFVPGHSPGHVALYCESQGFVIGGDVLFCGSIGRTDLPGGNFQTLERSIRTQLYVLPENTVVYCGHGPETTIGEERRYNPFVTA